MKKIGLISDTHSYLDEKVFEHFKAVDEIWHGGDFGNAAIADALKAFKPLRGVYGNIDGYGISSEFPEELIFMCEEVKVFMKHIGGYPGRYEPGVKNTIMKEKPQLFISGHSHILKIMYDDKLQCLHINPGAAGLQGWHKVKTLVRFVIDGNKIKNCEVIELGKRGSTI
ncbi:metallophosphoesterase family protein [Panacibacter ginsenosidivorans]|uniref:Phosphoesterase n=1 Tax=Panacibacter ginsenosidivorans TaxID=1813871 RepID=A0A5B8VDK0_9BACT|nr:metallophosphoesterase family protein [Panacibacter ginsenosidivorans]QEC68716.1 metallophosphoesterase family protein [Panacibacter ginsenosidivorans]